MPRVKLNKEAVEGSTYPITVSFTDEDGDPAVPNAGLAWTLTDVNGAVVNGRDAVTIAPAASVTIVLSGDDLAVAPIAGGKVTRLLAISGTYDSDLGSGLPIQDEVEFTVRGIDAL